MASDTPLLKSECPIGTVITVGHPGNQILAVKFDMTDDAWRYIYNGTLTDYDDIRKGQWDIYAIPQPS